MDIWFSALEWTQCLAQASPTLNELAQDLESLKLQVELLPQMQETVTQNLTSQVNFLSSQITTLSSSFTSFVNAMKWIVGFLAVLAAILTGFGSWIFKSSLDEAQTVAQNLISQRVESIIGEVVEERVIQIRQTLRREEVIGTTLVDYYLPHQTQPPSEFSLMQARGFQQVRFRSELGSLRRQPGDVVVLDLQNWQCESGEAYRSLFEGDNFRNPEAKAQREAAAKMLIDELLDVLSPSVVVVVYIKGQIEYLFGLNDRYVLAANNPVTLVGNVADGAYVVKGDRQM